MEPEVKRCKIKKAWICQDNTCEMVEGNFLLGHYDEAEEHYDAFTFDGNRGYVTIKIHTTGEDEKDEKHIGQMVAENEQLNKHAQLLNYEVSTVDDDMYFHRVTLKINYTFEPETATFTL